MTTMADINAAFEGADAALDRLIADAKRVADDNRRLRSIIAEAREYAEDRHDVLDGEDGPRPNDWMHLTNILEGR